MGFQKSHYSIKATHVTATVLQQSMEKSLALESENSKLRHDVSVLSWKLHKLERVEEEERQLGKVEFAGGVDVEPLVMEEEVAVVADKKFVVRLPVAVAESVAGAEVAEDAPIVEEQDWMVVKRKMRKRGENRRRRELEEERNAVRKRMNVWHPARVVVPNAPLGPIGMREWSRSDSVYGSPSLSGLIEKVVDSEGVERVGEDVVPRLQGGVPTGPRVYGAVALDCEMRKSFQDFGSVPEGKKVYGLDSGRGLVVYGGMRDWQGLGRNGYRGMDWYCRNQDGYLM
ncbi:hypothetical protein HOY80DRAFT_1065176 [Tuber brumale]|nr:hypothetical protein HOY80DRAFT_1065176 [Tuber brumale]